MRYLITGGAGFIGSHLVDALVARGDQAVVLDDLSTGCAENLEQVLHSEHVELVEGSTSDGELVDELMGSADFCFHLASAVGVKLIVDRPLDTLLRNVTGVQNVMGAAAKRRTPMLYTSTSEVYGKNSEGPLTEDSDRLVGSPFKARWTYAKAKALGESLAYCYHRETGAPFTVVRLFNTVGPRQTGRYGMVLPSFVRQALEGRDLTVYGNGTQTRCFTHVSDTVQAVVELADREDARGDVFNIGRPLEVPIIELARLVIERAGSDSRVNLVPYDDAYGDGFEELGRRKPNISRIHGLTGWSPARSLEDAIDDTIAFFRTQAEEQVPVAAALGSNGHHRE